MKLLFAFVLTIIFTVNTSAQWVRTNGPEGGAGYGIFEFNNKLFACTFDGMYISTDSAVSWKSAGLSNKEIFRTATFGSTIFASVDDTLFSTTDEGTSWKVQKTFGGIRIQDILVDGSSIYVPVFGADSTVGGLYNSTDNGSTWTKLTTSSTLSYIRSLCRAGNYLIAATRSNGIYRTSDNGVSWEKLTNNLTEDPTIWCAKSINDTIYVGGDLSFLYSTDMGSTWTIPQNTDLDSTNYFSIYTFAKLGKRIYASVDVQNGIWFSEDNGNNWYPINGGQYIPYRETAYALSIIGRDCYQQIDNGIFRTTDGGVFWSEHNKGIPALVSGVGFSDGDTLVAWGPRGLYLTGNGGNSWSHYRAIDEAWVNVRASITYKEDKYLYGEHYWQYNNGKLMRYSPGITDIVHFETALVRLTHQGALEYSSDGHFWTGFQFNQLPDSLSRPYGLASSGTSLILQCYNESYDTLRWYRSTDGLNWQRVYEGDFGIISFGYAVHKGVFYIGTQSSGLMRSDDDGLTWRNDDAIDKYAGIDALYSTGSLLFCDVLNDNITATDGINVRKESSGGFIFAGQGMPYSVSSLHLHTDNYLYAGSTGVWKRPLSELGISDDIVTKEIKTLRPNPASDYIIVDEDATVTLFTSTGSEVFTTKAVGDERIALPKLASGVYIAKIEAKSGVKTAKVVVQ